MRIATWNINGLRARIDYVDEWITARDPDLLAFQELKTPTDLFPHEHFERLGYKSLVSGQKSWNGVAILSKQNIPIEEESNSLPGQEEAGARYISAQVSTSQKKKLQFINLYCPNGKTLEHADFERKLRWFDSLTNQLSNENHAHRVLCGDFNIVPASIDTWKGEKGDGTMFHSTREREKMEALYQCGLVDIFRQSKPKAQEFSWWDYRSGAFHKNQGLRIDFILASQDLSRSVEQVFIDREYRKKIGDLTASDHAPVVADLVL